MDRQFDQLTGFLSSTHVISGVKASEIAAYFDEKELQKNALFLKEGQVNNEYLILSSIYESIFY